VGELGYHMEDIIEITDDAPIWHAKHFPNEELLVVITPRFVKPLGPDQKPKMPDWVEDFLPPVPEDKDAGTKKRKKDAAKPEFIGPRGHQEPK
jgi:hypothetical protein